MLRINLVLILVISNAFLGVQTSLAMPWPFSTQYEVMCPKGGCNVDGSNIFRCENKECAAIPTTLNAGRENGTYCVMMYLIAKIIILIVQIENINIQCNIKYIHINLSIKHSISFV